MDKSEDDVEVVVVGKPLEPVVDHKGDQGEQGAQGDQGDQGNRGAQGLRGHRGTPGVDAPVNDDLLDELKKVQSGLEFRKRVRLFLIIIGVAVAAALLSAVVSAFALYRVISYQNEACDRDNALRKAYTDQWNPVIAESPPPNKPPEDSLPEVIAAYEAQIRQREAFIKGLSTGFAQHPC